MMSKRERKQILTHVAYCLPLQAPSVGATLWHRFCSEIKFSEALFDSLHTRKKWYCSFFHSITVKYFAPFPLYFFQKDSVSHIFGTHDTFMWDYITRLHVTELYFLFDTPFRGVEKAFQLCFNITVHHLDWSQNLIIFSPFRMLLGNVREWSISSHLHKGYDRVSNVIE